MLLPQCFAFLCASASVNLTSTWRFHHSQGGVSLSQSTPSLLPGWSERKGPFGNFSGGRPGPRARPASPWQFQGPGWASGRSMIPEAMLLNCQGHPHLLQISSSFLGNGIEKSSLPGCCECWSDSGKPVRPGIDEAVSKCFSQTGWSTTSPSPLSPVSRFSFILPQRSGQPQSAGLSVYQVGAVLSQGSG